VEGGEEDVRSIGGRPASGSRRLAAAGCAVALALLAGCSGQKVDSSNGSGLPPAAHGAIGGNGANAQAAPAPAAARLDLRPADGDHDVSPMTPVVVSAADGTLNAVTVRNEAGRLVAGRLSADRTRWTSAEPLGYGKTYSVSATAANPAGKQVRAAAQFTTVTPVTYTLPYLFPSPEIKRVGVAQPITVHFDEAVTDRAAAERALHVTASPPAVGGWYWFDDQNVHWRPRTLWKPGTLVRVDANVYGVNVGGGIYGQQDVSTSFTIGPSRIATIDDRTHVMTVKIGGKVVRHVPVSMGRGGCIQVSGKSICFTTESGLHVVQEKYPVKEMKSESYGLPKNSPLGYDAKIPLAVRISAGGVFVHSAPWSVADQGVRNVSHGCVNISPANAAWFYSTFSYGDVVDIHNTGLQMQLYDKYGDWGLSWAKWLAGSALP
jgi:lipoprotein-anchoring transpeptidase ErfK/SrfK